MNDQNLLQLVRNTSLKIKTYQSEGLARIFSGKGYVNDLDLDVYLPTYGRHLQRSFIWTVEQKQNLVQSVIRGYDIGPICVVQKLQSIPNNAVRYRTWQVIDGKQRINALFAFMRNEFTISIFDKSYSYCDLPLDVRAVIDSFSFTAHVVWEHAGNVVTDQHKLEWFCRINFSGTSRVEGHDQCDIKCKNND